MKETSLSTHSIVEANAALGEAISGFSQLKFESALDAADALESLARSVKYAQIVIAARVNSSEALARSGSSEFGQFRNATEVLQARLRISRHEARRRSELGAKLLPQHSLTGEEIPAKHPVLAELAGSGSVSRTGLERAVTALDDAGAVVSGREDGARVLQRMEQSLSEALLRHDPDFLKPMIQRWFQLIDQDGSEPDDSELRRRQGLFRRRVYRGLVHFEMWADSLQAETLMTVINAGNNPRTQLANSYNAAVSNERSESAHI